MKKAIAILLVLLVAGMAFGATVGVGVANGFDVVATNTAKTELTVTQEAVIGVTEKIDLASGTTDFVTGVKVGSWDLFSNSRVGLKVTYETTAGFTSANLTALGGDFTSYAVPFNLSIDGGTNYSLSTTLATTPAEFTLTRNGSGAYLDSVNNGDIHVQRVDSTTEYAEAQDYTTTITLKVQTI